MKRMLAIIYEFASECRLQKIAYLKILQREKFRVSERSGTISINIINCHTSQC